MRASGLLRLKVLIATGDRRNYYHYYPGYPCEAVSGHAMAWLCAHGVTASLWGENRRQILIAIEAIPHFSRTGADAGSAATLMLGVTRELTELPRFSLQMRVHKSAEIKAVTFDGNELGEGEDDGFVVWEDTASRIVRLNLRVMMGPGEHAAAVHYDVRWT
jgi:hypothetical protein